MKSNGDRRASMLAEIGVGPVWTRRNIPAAGGRQSMVESAPNEPLSQGAEGTPPDLPLDLLPNMPPVPVQEETIPAAKAPTRIEVASMDWSHLKESVAGCVKCGLCQGRTNTVFGVGDEKATWMFIGEGPGRNEDLRGEPFVGQAGKLLDNMLSALGLRRGENAYIANVVKCRPTDNSGKDRPPTAEEASACLPYLERQIALIQPTVLVALGKTAALSLLALNPDTPVSKLRGTVHRYADRPLIVTYHPAYLLRNMADKKKAWSDLCLAKAAHDGLD